MKAAQTPPPMFPPVRYCARVECDGVVRPPRTRFCSDPCGQKFFNDGRVRGRARQRRGVCLRDGCDRPVAGKRWKFCSDACVAKHFNALRSGVAVTPRAALAYTRECAAPDCENKIACPRPTARWCSGRCSSRTHMRRRRAKAAAA